MPTRPLKRDQPDGSAKPARKPGRPRRGDQNPEMLDRRARIIAVATKRIATFGYEQTTVRQIADDVNILSGSLYHHFGTKDDILHEIVREPVERLRDNALRIAKADADPEHRLVALILLDLNELVANQQPHAILYNERKMFRRNPEFAYVLKAKKEAYAAWRLVLEDGARDGLFNGTLDTYLAISTIIRMLNVAADWFRNEEPAMVDPWGSYSFDSFRDFYLTFILGAVRTTARVTAPIPIEKAQALAVSS